MQAQGSLWQALGVLTAAGALRSAVILLQRLKLPDRVAVYIEAAHAAGFGSHSDNSATGYLSNVLLIGKPVSLRR